MALYTWLTWYSKPAERSSKFLHAVVEEEGGAVERRYALIFHQSTPFHGGPTCDLTSTTAFARICNTTGGYEIVDSVIRNKTHTCARTTNSATDFLENTLGVYILGSEVRKRANSMGG